MLAYSVIYFAIHDIGSNQPPLILDLQVLLTPMPPQRSWLLDRVKKRVNVEGQRMLSLERLASPVGPWLDLRSWFLGCPHVKSWLIGISHCARLFVETIRFTMNICFISGRLGFVHGKQMVLMWPAPNKNPRCLFLNELSWVETSRTLRHCYCWGRMCTDDFSWEERGMQRPTYGFFHPVPVSLLLMIRLCILAITLL